MKNIDETLNNWERESLHDWYAVDRLSPQQGKTPWKLTRLMVTDDRDRAMDFAGRMAMGIDLEGEPGEFGSMDFYRCTMVEPSIAHDFLRGIVNGNDEMLTLTDAAKVAGVSRQAMHERIQRGRIPAEYIGSTIFVVAQSLVDFRD